MPAETPVAPVEEGPTIEMPTFVTNSETAPQIDATMTTPAIETPAPIPTPVVEQVQPVVETPVIDMPAIEQPTPVSPIEEVSPAPEFPQVAEQQLPETPTEPMIDVNQSLPTTGQTGDVLAAMNAIKNLALSIQSIGYKLTINEENEIDKYKITIELQK